MLTPHAVLTHDSSILPLIYQQLSHAGHARELALTARTFSGTEAKNIGLVSAVLSDQKTLMRHGADVATSIAAKSPVAVAGTKQVLLYQRFGGKYDGL